MSTKQDFFYPLERESLIARYHVAFDSIARGNSAVIWGFPHSAANSFLKFIFSQTDLLEEFIPGKKPVFIHLDFDSLTDATNLSFHKHLLSQFIELFHERLEKFKAADKKLLDQAKATLQSGDSYAIFQTSIRLLKTFYQKSDLKITIVLSDYAVSKLDESLGRNLYKLWSIERKHPYNRMSFLFVTPPYLSPHELPPFLKPLRIAYFESTSDFPLFDDQELEYTYDRLEQMYGVELTAELRVKALKFLGGYYGFFVPLVNSVEKFGSVARNIEKAWFADETMNYFADELLMSLPEDVISELREGSVKSQKVKKILKRFHLSPMPKMLESRSKILLSNQKSTQRISHSFPNGIQVTEPLTNQEYLAISYFVKHAGEIVSKLDLAEVIWGPDHDFSDWAIDKLISRLRKKIITKGNLNPILTIRNAGYKFIE